MWNKFNLNYRWNHQKAFYSFLWFKCQTQAEWCFIDNQLPNYLINIHDGLRNWLLVGIHIREQWSLATSSPIVQKNDVPIAENSLTPKYVPLFDSKCALGFSPQHSIIRFLYSNKENAIPRLLHYYGYVHNFPKHYQKWDWNHCTFYSESLMFANVFVSFFNAARKCSTDLEQRNRDGFCTKRILSLTAATGGAHLYSVTWNAYVFNGRRTFLQHIKRKVDVLNNGIRSPISVPHISNQITIKTQPSILVAGLHSAALEWQKMW